MQKSLNEKLELFRVNYDILNRKLGWICSREIVLLLTSQYTGNEKKVDIDSFVGITGELKDSTGFFTTLDGNVRSCLAALIDLQMNKRINSVQILIAHYKRLVDSGFPRGSYTYFSAWQLMQMEEGKKESAIQKAHDIYRGFRNEHFFLTGYDDYPAALFLSELKEEPPTIAEMAKTFFKALKSKGFSTCNELQFLANVLTYGGKPLETSVKDVVSIRDFLTGQGLKIRREHFVSLGILSFLEVEDKDLNQIVELHSLLIREKALRWYKHMAVSIAIDLYTKDQIDDLPMKDTGLMVAIEAIMQAQQAATIVATSAAIAASSSN